MNNHDAENVPTAGNEPNTGPMSGPYPMDDRVGPGGSRQLSEATGGAMDATAPSVSNEFDNTVIYPPLVSEPSQPRKMDGSKLAMIVTVVVLAVALIAGGLWWNLRAKPIVPPASGGSQSPSAAPGRPSVKPSESSKGSVDEPATVTQMVGWMEANGFTCVEEPVSGFVSYMCAFEVKDGLTSGKAFVAGPRDGQPSRVALTVHGEVTDARTRAAKEKLLGLLIPDKAERSKAVTALAAGTKNAPGRYETAAVLAVGRSNDSFKAYAAGLSPQDMPKAPIMTSDASTMGIKVMQLGYMCSGKESNIFQECTKKVDGAVFTVKWETTEPEKMSSMWIGVEGANDPDALAKELDRVWGIMGDDGVKYKAAMAKNPPQGYSFAGNVVLDYYPQRNGRGQLILLRPCWTNKQVWC